MRAGKSKCAFACLSSFQMDPFHPFRTVKKSRGEGKGGAGGSRGEPEREKNSPVWTGLRPLSKPTAPLAHLSTSLSSSVHKDDLEHENRNKQL